MIRRRKGGDHTLAALKSIRAARPDGAPIYVILDNLSANKTPAIRAWAKRNKVELCFTPTNASWANPIEAQFGPLRSFVIGNSNHPNHTVLARDLQDYLRWRNANARHPDVLAAQRRERARIRSERQHRWGRPRPKPPDHTRRTFRDSALAVGGPRLLSHAEAEYRDGARLGVAERFQVDPVEAWGREADAVAE